ncbi:MAG: hypothetical protein M1482_13630 [Chloroflexi bacterium]|nr:hypothetical protein [Chloroflexota bacterium]
MNAASRAAPGPAETEARSRLAAGLVVLCAGILGANIAACALLPSPTVAPSPTIASAPTAQAALSPLATASAPAPAATLSSGGDWATYHDDNTRTGYIPNMPDPQRLTLAWKTALDGAVYAEPLVV